MPPEVKALLRGAKRSLELGCGLGRLSRYAAGQGVDATGIDWSPVAIEKARARVAGDAVKPDLRVGDVTKLDGLTGPFDVAFDVGCFHCLDREGEGAYAAELHRLLAPRGTLLIWAIDHSPSDLVLTPGAMREIFAPHFTLARAETSRRRIIGSHWYWLERR